jgi:hypothetical protein
MNAEYILLIEDEQGEFFLVTKGLPTLMPEKISGFEASARLAQQADLRSLLTVSSRHQRNKYMRLVSLGMLYDRKVTKWDHHRASVDQGDGSFRMEYIPSGETVHWDATLPAFAVVYNDDEICKALAELEAKAQVEAQAQLERLQLQDARKELEAKQWLETVQAEFSFQPMAIERRRLVVGDKSAWDIGDKAVFDRLRFLERYRRLKTRLQIPTGGLPVEDGLLTIDECWLTLTSDHLYGSISLSLCEDLNLQQCLELLRKDAQNRAAKKAAKKLEQSSTSLPSGKPKPVLKRR